MELYMFAVQSRSDCWDAPQFRREWSELSPKSWRDKKVVDEDNSYTDCTTIQKDYVLLLNRGELVQ